MNIYQSTIIKDFSLSGKGLHTGKTVTVHIEPAPEDSGISFIRTDLSPNIKIPANAQFSGDCSRCSVLEKDGTSISTLEHLMSALCGLQIDNATIYIDGPEVPILDGSAKLWADELIKAGIATQTKQREIITPQKAFEFSTDSGARYKITPDDHFSVTCDIDFHDDIIGKQTAQFENFDQYITEIAPCKTFVFLHDILPLLKMGLIKGGDLENALVYARQDCVHDLEMISTIFNKPPESITVTNGLLNNTSQTFSNEPARHKLLDFIGDIYLVGKPINAHFDIYCPGHKSNLQLAQKLQQLL